MYISRRLLVAALAALLAAGSMTFALGASGKGSDDSQNHLFFSTLAPSVPTDPAIHGRTPGGVPWVLEKGSTSLQREGKSLTGRLRVQVRGLVIPALGTADGVVTITASLFCAPDADATAKATTPPAPLSPDGDAELDAQVTLPPSCLAPVVLIHPNGIQARYIAAMGFKLATTSDD